MIENWHDSPPPTLPSPAATTKFFRPTDLKSVSSSEISPLPSVCSPPATPMFAPSIHGITEDEDTPDQSPTMPSPPRSTKIIRFNKSTSNEPHHVLADTTNTTTTTANKYSESGSERVPERVLERGLERTSVVMVGNFSGCRYLNHNSSPITPYAVKNRIIENTPYRAPPLDPSRGPSCSTHVIQPSEKCDSTPTIGISVDGQTNPPGTGNKVDGGGNHTSFQSNNTVPTPATTYANVSGGTRPNNTAPTPVTSGATCGNVSGGIKPNNTAPTPVTGGATCGNVSGGIKPNNPAVPITVTGGATCGNVSGGIKPNNPAVPITVTGGVPAHGNVSSDGIRANNTAVPTTVPGGVSNSTVPKSGDMSKGAISTLDSMMFQGVLELGLVPPWIPVEFVRPSVPVISYEEKRHSIEALFFMEVNPRGNGIPSSIAPAFSVESIKHILWKMNLSEVEIKEIIDDLSHQETLETFQMWGRCYWRRKGAFLEWSKSGKCLTT